MLGVLVDLQTAGKETSHVTVYDAGDAVTHCCYPSAATSQFLFFELVYQSGWPLFWNENVKMLLTLSVLKFLSLWQRHSESLPNLRFRTPPALPEEAIFMRCLLCEEMVLHQQWKGCASCAPGHSCQRFFFFFLKKKKKKKNLKIKKKKIKKK